jgi:hypothetical protein
VRRILLISCSSLALALVGAAPAAAQVTITPAEADFGKQTVKTESPPKQFTLSTGPVGPPGGYAADPDVGSNDQFRMVSHTCPSTMPPNTSCTISVVFAPFYPGFTGGTLRGNRASPTGVTADLSGEGIAAPSGNGNGTGTGTGKGKGKKCKKGKKGVAAARKKRCKKKKK